MKRTAVLHHTNFNPYFLFEYYQTSILLCVNSLFMIIIFLLIKCWYALGTLKPNPRFGPFPKVTLAVMVGYFIGKLSYQQACAEKLMALPGSYIGQLLRERKEGKVGGRYVSALQTFGHNVSPSHASGRNSPMKQWHSW